MSKALEEVRAWIKTEPGMCLIKKDGLAFLARESKLLNQANKNVLTSKKVTAK